MVLCYFTIVIMLVLKIFSILLHSCTTFRILQIKIIEIKYLYLYGKFKLNLWQMLSNKGLLVNFLKKISDLSIKLWYNDIRRVYFFIHLKCVVTLCCWEYNHGCVTGDVDQRCQGRSICFGWFDSSHQGSFRKENQWPFHEPSKRIR